MAKPTALTAAILEVPQVTPKAATPARGQPAESPAIDPPDQIPLQLRLPREEVKAIKVAAAQSEHTISEFMLACFHAYMRSGNHA
jgi:hypothetical protein